MLWVRHRNHKNRTTAVAHEPFKLGVLSVTELQIDRFDVEQPSAGNGVDIENLGQVVHKS